MILHHYYGYFKYEMKGVCLYLARLCTFKSVKKKIAKKTLQFCTREANSYDIIKIRNLSIKKE